MQNSVDIVHGNTHVYKCLARSYHLTLKYIDIVCAADNGFIHLILLIKMFMLRFNMM